MKILSVNCGLPREINRHEKKVTTSIYKEPMVGRIALRTLNLDGDRQSDLKVHGGKDKAVYLYPAEYYDYWRRELARASMPPGSFGENFTVDGLAQESLAEDAIHVGDRRTGFYAAVLREGDVGAGDGLVMQGRETDSISVSEVTRLYLAKQFGPENARQARRAMAVEALPESWKTWLQEKLSRLQA